MTKTFDDYFSPDDFEIDPKKYKFQNTFDARHRHGSGFHISQENVFAGADPWEDVYKNDHKDAVFYGPDFCENFDFFNRELHITLKLRSLEISKNLSFKMI